MCEKKLIVIFLQTNSLVTRNKNACPERKVTQCNDVYELINYRPHSTTRIDYKCKCTDPAATRLLNLMPSYCLVRTLINCRSASYIV